MPNEREIKVGLAKSGEYIEEMVSRFEEGLIEMVKEGSDVFAFSFDVDPKATIAPQTAIVLIRPKSIADSMLQAIEFARTQGFNPAAPKAAKSIDGVG